MSDAVLEDADEGLPRPEAEVARELRLRPEPPRVTRLSRKVMIGVGALGAIGLGGALILALETRDTKQPEQELYHTDNKPAADGLAGLPRDYSAIPKLGPPLPGDFARPMLDAQNRAVSGSAGVVPATAAPPNPAVQRRQQEDEAAIRGDLFAAKTSAATEQVSAPASPPSSTADLGTAPSPDQPQAPPPAAARKQSFLNASPDKHTLNDGVLQPPADTNIVQAGTVIPAAMITGLRSDLPGQIVAQVTQSVYDSPTGRILLIPQGARLIGTYDNDIAAGQSRALVAWTRLILPDGRAVTLDRMPGADAQGFAGLQDRTDYHWGGLLRAALVSTILGVGAQSGSNNGSTSISQAIRDGASESIARTGRQIVDRELNRPPTITIRPGFPVRVIVTRDLILTPWAER